MNRILVTNYVIHSPKRRTCYPLSSAKKAVYLDEKREDEFYINSEPVDEMAFNDWLIAFYEMPDECTSIEEWEA